MDTQRLCLHCGISFTPKPASKLIQKFCSTKCREASWVSINRERLNATVRRYRARRYEKDGCWRETGPKAQALLKWMNEIKSQPCHDCGNRFPICCMDFDHREGTTKKYNVGSMFAHHHSKESIEEEVAKCDLVCSNCHRIRTQKRRKGVRIKKAAETDWLVKTKSNNTQQDLFA